MKTLKDRAKAFEAKFAHDAEMMFRVQSRRNRLLGMWAAGLMGKSGEDAVAYAREVVRADLAEAGIEGLVRKLTEDLGDRADEAAIRAQIAATTDEAKSHVLDEIEGQR